MSLTLSSTPSFKITAMNMATIIGCESELMELFDQYDADIQKINEEKFQNMRPGLLELAKSVLPNDTRMHADIENATDCSKFDGYLEVLLEHPQDSRARIAAEVNAILDRILIASQTTSY